MGMKRWVSISLLAILVASGVQLAWLAGSAHAATPAPSPSASTDASGAINTSNDPPGCPGSTQAGTPTAGDLCSNGDVIGADKKPHTPDLPKPSCNVGSFSWAVCPLISVGQNAVYDLTRAMLHQLKLEPLTTDGNYAPLYAAWSAFRNIANGLFVLLFLVIIFSNSLSLEIDAYTIKKMLPRLVAAVVLVQASYFIMQIGIDVANILGNGIGYIFGQVLATTGATGGNGAGYQALGVFQAGGLMGSFIVGSVFIEALGALWIPLLLVIGSAIVALIGIFLTLGLRSILIQMMVLISPIAFIAWVLPGTASMFKLWQKNTIRLLLMYPLIRLLISTGDLISHLGHVTNSSTIGNLLASLAPIMVLFMIPATFKMAGSVMGMTANAINNRTSRASKRLRSGQLMKNSMASAREEAALNWAGEGKKGVSVFGREIKTPSVLKSMGRKGAGRVISGNTLTRTAGRQGQRKQAKEYESARSVQQADEISRLGAGKHGLENPDLGRAIEAVSKGQSKFLTRDGREIDINERTGEAAMALLASNGGVPELISAFDRLPEQGGLGLRDMHTKVRQLNEVQSLVDKRRENGGRLDALDTAKLRTLTGSLAGKGLLQAGPDGSPVVDDKGTVAPTDASKALRDTYRQRREVWDRALGSNKGAILQKATHLIHAQGMDALTDSKAALVVGTHSKYTSDLITGAIATEQGASKLLNSYRDVGASGTMKAEVDQAKLLQFHELATAPDNNARATILQTWRQREGGEPLNPAEALELAENFDKAKINVKGVGEIDAKRFATEFMHAQQGEDGRIISVSYDESLERGGLPGEPEAGGGDAGGGGTGPGDGTGPGTPPASFNPNDVDSYYDSTVDAADEAAPVPIATRPTITTATTPRTVSPGEIAQINQNLRNFTATNGGGTAVAPAEPVAGDANFEAPAAAAQAPVAPAQAPTAGTPMVQVTMNDGRRLFLNEYAAQAYEEAGTGKITRDRNDRIVKFNQPQQ